MLDIQQGIMLTIHAYWTAIHSATCGFSRLILLSLVSFKSAKMHGDPSIKKSLVKWVGHREYSSYFSVWDTWTDLLQLDGGVLSLRPGILCCRAVSCFEPDWSLLSSLFHWIILIVKSILWSKHASVAFVIVSRLPWCPMSGRNISEQRPGPTLEDV